MSARFEPKMEILPAPQRALWPELATIPRSFVLYGGTGLALRLGHRTSVDFDFLSSDPLAHSELRGRVSLLTGAETLQEEPGALTVSVNRAGPVKVSFFGPIGFGRVGVPLEQILAAGRALFGPAFNPIVARKALAYFDGGNLSALDRPTRDLLVRESTRDVVHAPLPLLSPRLE